MKFTFKQAQALLEPSKISLHGIKNFTSEKMGLDSAPSSAMVTQPNNGLPSVLATTIDPQVIRAILAPMRSEEIYGSVQKGNRIDRIVLFPIAENLGTTASYSDFSNAGSVGVNVNWEERMSVLIQTMINYGDLENEIMNRSSINYANELRTSAIITLSRRVNLINLYGIDGKNIRGALNDPDLSPAIAPLPKAVNGATKTKWDETGDPNAIYDDILALFQKLNIQLMGNIDTNTAMTLVIPAELSQVMAYTNGFGITFEDILKKSFPNMTVETLPEAGTSMNGGMGNLAGRIVQLFVKSIDGIDSVFTAFTSKFTLHRLVPGTTSYVQKASQGTNGTIWRRPTAVVTMIGV